MIPLYSPCGTTAGSRECATVLVDDLSLVITELKACCIAVGGSDKHCDVDE